MNGLQLKLLKFAGFTQVWNVWSYPDGATVEHGHLPRFLGDETACFKWLAPELEYINVYYDKHLGFIVFVDGGAVCYEGTGKNLALTLCLAIEKLIDKEAE